jgi:uncharacterized damage-inducible protein DinB
MTLRDVQRLFDYYYWANGRLMEVVSQLTPEEFTQSVAGSYGSVRSTLVHIVSAEWGWLGRCGGPKRGAPLSATDYPTVESLVDTARKVESYMRDFLPTLTDADLERTVEFALPGSEPRAMLLGSLLQHAALHGVHHRGQVALLLRSLGYAPGNFDLLLYDIEKQAAMTS